MNGAKRTINIKSIANLNMGIHYYRYKRHTDKNLICPLCRVVQETELHFVLCCLVLRTLRAQFIPLKFDRFPRLFPLSLLLAATNENIVRNLSVYLYKAFKLIIIINNSYKALFFNQS